MKELVAQIISSKNRRNRNPGRRTCMNEKNWGTRKLRAFTDDEITFDQLEILLKEYIMYRFANCRHNGQWAADRVSEQMEKLRKKISKKIRQLDG